MKNQNGQPRKTMCEIKGTAFNESRMRGTNLGGHTIDRCWGILQKDSLESQGCTDIWPSSMAGDGAVKDTVQVPM